MNRPFSPPDAPNPGRLGNPAGPAYRAQHAPSAAFWRAFADERRARRAVRDAYLTLCRVERRFGDRLRDWGVVAALDRLLRVEADADEMHRAQGERLALLWDRASRQMAPIDIVTDADAYLFDAVPDEAADFVADLLARRVIADPLDIIGRADPRAVIADTILHPRRLVAP